MIISLLNCGQLPVLLMKFLWYGNLIGLVFLAAARKADLIQDTVEAGYVKWSAVRSNVCVLAIF